MLEKCRISGFADEIDANFDVQLRVLNEIGQGFLELRGADGCGVADFTIEKARELKEKMRIAGVGVSSIGSPIGKIGITDDFTKHFESYKHIVELAHFFDTKNIRMFSFYLPDENQPDLYKDAVFERMERFIEYAKKQEVTLLHENEKGIYGAKALECKNLLDAFYGPNFKGIFDFANFIQCKQDTLEAYEMLKSYIAYIHVKDAMWDTGEVVLPGTGNGNLAAIFSDLDKNGFDGFLSLEPHLFHFAGLDQLEKGPVERKESNGILAYKAAHKSLCGIIC